jgi:cell division septum initiation protein DivIVA
MSRYQTIESLEQEIAKHQEEIAKIQKQIEQAKKEKPEYRVAKQLHDLACTWNHTDACGWFYEINKDGEHDWNRHAHEKYLKKATMLLHTCIEKRIDLKQAIELYKIIRE